MGFFLGLIVGLVVGAAVTALLLRRSPPAPAAAVVPVAEPAPQPPPPAAPAADTSATSAEESPSQDLKPVLDATRGVLSELEQRYQGAKAPEKTKPPRRRA